MNKRAIYVTITAKRETVAFIFPNDLTMHFTSNTFTIIVRNNHQANRHTRSKTEKKQERKREQVYVISKALYNYSYCNYKKCKQELLDCLDVRLRINYNNKTEQFKLGSKQGREKN